MTRADLVRLAGFLLPAAGAVVLLRYAREIPVFLLAALAVLLIGIPVEWLYGRLASKEQRRRDLEERVRNPPS